MKEFLSSNQLYALLDSIALLNSTLDLDKLLHIVMEQITLNLHADRSTLYIVDHARKEIWSKILQGDETLHLRFPIGQGISGIVAESGDVLNIADAYRDPRFNQEVDKNSGYRTKSMLCVPVKAQNGLILGVIQALNKKDGPFTKMDELYVSLFSNHIALAIQNAVYHRKAIKQQKVKNELEIARTIQQRLLPKENLQVIGYDIAWNVTTCEELGGDYIDFWKHNEKWRFIIADIVGKGIPAALLMSNLQAAIHIMADEEISLENLVYKLNRHIFNVTHGDKYLTCVIGEINTHSDEVQLVRCGHIYPLHVVEEDGNRVVHQIKSSGLPLGIHDDPLIAVESICMKSGQVLFLCSDGITETYSKQRGFLGMDRLQDFIRRSDFINSNMLIEKLNEYLHRYAGNQKADDDRSIWILRKL